MPDATITSTASTFGTITGTFAADQSTVTGTVTGIITGTLSGSVGVPGPKGDTGPQGQQGEPGEGVPAGGLEGQILLKASDTSYDTVWADNSAETLTATVRNETGATLSKGTVVYITGAAGNKALVSKASAASEATSSKTFAILSQDIPNNQNGTAVTVGLLKGLNTSALTEGGSLWLSTTAGQWTQTMPTAPNHAVFLGTVTRVHANQGTVEVRIQNGLELQELHNVKITSVANGQVLKYDSAQSLWVNGTDVGVPAGGTAGQFLQKIDSTDYNTDWVTLNLSAYLTKAGNLSGLTDLAASRDNLGLGSLSTPTFAGVNVPGSGTSVANLGATFLTLNQQGHGQFTIQPSQGIVFPDATVQTTAYPGPAGATAWGTITGTLSSQTDLQTALDGKYSTSNPAGYITSAALTPYLLSSTAASTYYPLTNPSGYITSSALAGYATESWVTSQGYITSSALTGYATESWVTAGFYPLASNPAGYLTSAALTPYLLSSTAASTYYPLTNPAGYITSSALAGYATESWVTSQGYITSAALSPYLTSATAASTYLTQSNAASTYYLQTNPAGYITSAALSGYATESWVTSQGYLTSAPVTSVAGRTGAITLSTSDISGLGTMATASVSDYSTTTVANGLYYPLNSNPAGYLTTAPVTSVAGKTGAVTLTNTDISGLGTMATATASDYLAKADNLSGLASTSTARTNLGLGTLATVNDAPSDGNEYVRKNAAWSVATGGASYITSVSSPLSVTSSNLSIDLSAYAPLASPALTGVPTAPTAAVGTNTTQIATTAFVLANAGGGGSGGVNIQTFGSPTSSGTFTWTKPAGAKWVEVYLIAGGSGGGSGARRATTSIRGGGSGGNPGSCTIIKIPADYLSSTESVVVGAGGTGAVSATADNSNGSTGNQGGSTSFGGFNASSGFGGNAGTNTAGGSVPSGQNGILLGLQAVSGTNASAGTANNVAPSSGSQSGITAFGVGGGGGAGAAANNTTNTSGGAGGRRSTFFRAGIIAGGSAGTSAGVAAGDGTSVSPWYQYGSVYGGTGGGGGFYITGAIGGNGGNGGWPGGGGGGGGASDNGFNSGAGGNGGNGFAVIITYF